MGPPPNFEIQESRTDGRLRLSLTGELDFASVQMLDERLTSLRATRSPVSLDLSRLEFVDSTGIRLLIRTIGDARIKRWPLSIEPDVSPEVRRVFRLVHLDRFLAGGEPAIS